MSAEISPGREYGLPGDSKPKGLLFAFFFDVGSPYTFVQKIDGIVRLAFPNDNTAFREMQDTECLVKTPAESPPAAAAQGRRRWWSRTGPAFRRGRAGGRRSLSPGAAA